MNRNKRIIVSQLIKRYLIYLKMNYASGPLNMIYLNKNITFKCEQLSKYIP